MSLWKNLLPKFLVVVVLSLPACKPADPVYPHDGDLGIDSAPLVSRDLTLSYDPELLKGRVTGEPDMSQISVQAIKAVVRRVVKLLEAGAFNRLPAALVVPEQAEQIQKLVDVLQPLVEKSAALQQALSSKPGTQAENAAVPQQVMTMIQTSIDNAQITFAEEHTALMTLQLEMALPGLPGGRGPASGPQRMEIPFVQLEDGNWRVEVPEELFPPTRVFDEVASALQLQIPQMLRSLDQIKAQIDAGTLADPQVIAQQLMMSQAPLMAAAAPLVKYYQELGTHQKPPDDAEDAAPAEDETDSDNTGEEDQTGG